MNKYLYINGETATPYHFAKELTRIIAELNLKKDDEFEYVEINEYDDSIRKTKYFKIQEIKHTVVKYSDRILLASTKIYLKNIEQ